ncbi:MAG: DUF2249 domain-containing protein [Rhizobiales bacterium]|nr:DUF2249 domain-containing protein [Hyphomicrobiales bacterium]
MDHPPYDLDVRPILREGGEPFSAIMEAVAALAPGQSLRLLATFKPLPLFQVLGARGFEAAAREIGNGDWEVLFTPVRPAGPQAEAPQGASGEWPEPSQRIDCRDMVPPEPMAKTMEAVEALVPGQTLEALLPREPRFLFPELEGRGHAWKGEAQPDGSYRIVIRRGGRTEAT